MGTYIVTGRASGIGAATKRELIFECHRVIVVDIKDCDVIADLATMDGRKAAVAGVRKSAPEGVDGLVICTELHPVEPKKKF